MDELKNKRIVFHGTQNKDFKSFTSENIGQGGDPNSCLGVFFAEDPYIASEYAGEDGVVIVALIKEEKTLICDMEHEIVLIPEAVEKYRQDCFENNCEPLEEIDFFESKDDYKICASFARDFYLAQGFQSFQYSAIGSDDPICVALNADEIEVLAILTPEQAELLSEEIREFEDFYDQARRFKALTELKSDYKLLEVNKNLNHLKK